MKWLVPLASKLFNATRSAEHMKQMKSCARDQHWIVQIVNVWRENCFVKLDNDLNKRWIRDEIARCDAEKIPKWIFRALFVGLQIQFQLIFICSHWPKGISNKLNIFHNRIHWPQIFAICPFSWLPNAGKKEETFEFWTRDFQSSAFAAVKSAPTTWMCETGRHNASTLS